MEGGCKERCYKEMQGYSAHCTRCRDRQVEEGTLLEKVEDQVYFGESSRSLKTRADGHLKDYRSHQGGGKAKPVSSWMWDHTVSHHQGVINQDPSSDFQFRLQGVYRDCLSRQLDEAVRIRMAEDCGRVVGDQGEGVGGRVQVLNRKEEHYQPKTVNYCFYN